MKITQPVLIKLKQGGSNLRANFTCLHLLRYASRISEYADV